MLENGPHRETEVAVVVFHEGVARNEVEDPRVAREVSVKRTRIIAAVAASAAELAAPTAARSGQKETVAVRGSKEPPVHAVLRRPCAGSVIKKLLYFLSCRHTPTCAPVGCSGVILGQQGGQSVGEAVVSIARVAAVLGQRVIVAVAVLVGAPAVGVFRLRLAPGKIISVFLVHWLQHCRWPTAGRWAGQGQHIRGCQCRHLM